MPVVKTLTDSSTFLEKWAWSVRNMVGASGKPDELKESYFSSLYEHSDRRNINGDKLSKYDTMVRDEIQIKAEKKYLFEQGRTEAMKEMAAKLKAMGMAADTICEVTGLPLVIVAGIL